MTRDKKKNNPYVFRATIMAYVNIGEHDGALDYEVDGRSGDGWVHGSIARQNRDAANVGRE